MARRVSSIGTIRMNRRVISKIHDSGERGLRARSNGQYRAVFQNMQSRRSIFCNTMTPQDTASTLAAAADRSRERRSVTTRRRRREAGGAVSAVFNRRHGVSAGKAASNSDSRRSTCGARGRSIGRPGRNPPGHDADSPKRCGMRWLGRGGGALAVSGVFTCQKEACKGFTVSSGISRAEPGVGSRFA
jgi:hypothetical protein